MPGSAPCPLACASCPMQCEGTDLPDGGTTMTCLSCNGDDPKFCYDCGGRPLLREEPWDDFEGYYADGTGLCIQASAACLRGARIGGKLCCRARLPEARPTAPATPSCSAQTRSVQCAAMEREPAWNVHWGTALWEAHAQNASKAIGGDLGTTRPLNGHCVRSEAGHAWLQWHTAVAAAGPASQACWQLCVSRALMCAHDAMQLRWRHQRVQALH